MSVVKIPVITDDAVINISLDTINKTKQALIFVGTKKSAEKTAEELSKKTKLNNKELDDVSYKILNSLDTPTKQCIRLANCVKQGVAFHHAGLVAEQRSIIEESFKNGLIKIICCTPTLAFGVDLPAFRVVIKDLKRYVERYGMRWIPVLEYLQISGRCGRPRYDKFGESIAIASSESDKDKIIETYINGEPEEIISKLAVEPVLRTYLLSLIAIEFVNTKKQILDFFEKTFWAFQYEDMEELENKIDKMLSLLKKWGFIEMQIDKDDFVSADKIGKEKKQKINATIVGKRIAELYIDPLTANFLIKCLNNSKRKAIKEISFLQVISHTLEIRPLLRAREKEKAEIEAKLLEYNDYLLEPEPNMFDPFHDDFIDSVKTAFFFMEWIDEKDEEFLLEKHNIRPGEIRAKLDIADWLLYCMEEFCRILKMQPVIKDITKLRMRMKYGAKEELLPLLKLENIGRVRARKLYNNKIKDIADVKKANIATLIQILGEKIAYGIKKQVGQNIEKQKIPERKRKGQISLNDWG